MTAIDIAEVFIGHARQAESDELLGIDYRIASAVELPFDDGTFDFATGFMSFMDVPETDRVLAEAFRVLGAGRIPPVLDLPPVLRYPTSQEPAGTRTVRTYAIEVGDYFRDPEGRVEEWLFQAAPPEARAGLPKFQVPRFNRTISQWLNLHDRIRDSPWSVLRNLGPATKQSEDYPALQDAQVVSYFPALPCQEAPDRLAREPNTLTPTATTRTWNATSANSMPG